MSTAPHSMEEYLRALKSRWRDYREQGSFEQFVEFALALNNITEQFSRFRLPGLVRQCQGLESAALALFGNPSTHPIGEQQIIDLERQLDTILHAVEMAQPQREHEQRTTAAPSLPFADWTKPRVVWLIASASHPKVCGLTEQLTFFGFRVQRFDWQAIEVAVPEGESPLVALFIPTADGYGSGQLEGMKRICAAHPGSQIFCLSVPKSLDAIVTLLRAGADVTIQAEQQTTTVLSRILELVQSQEQEAYRVLVVEDSATAVAQIQRSLAQYGFESRAIRNPKQLLAAADQYCPDLVLMDMYMPFCTGVEATRVLRQIVQYQSLPVVYLSSETDMGMQVEALRLGGDQFITKPFNPVLLTAVVRTKIERYREMQRSSQHDSLTGLLNHSAVKTRLDQLVQSLGENGRLCVAMLDIDHFKSINDTYGHPVGDQVIRGLAWLLKGRLRGSDLIGRYGGEEFLIALADIDLEDAHTVVDHIRRDFSTLPHAHVGGALRATFSAGIAAFTSFSTGKELTQTADEALLEAKQLGRNRVERGPH